MKLILRVCECFTFVISAVAAHTELVRTLTTAPPAKRQPASSTGNLIKIMSLLHYITNHCSFLEHHTALKPLLAHVHRKLYAFCSLEMFHCFSLLFQVFNHFHIVFFLFFYPDNCTAWIIYISLCCMKNERVRAIFLINIEMNAYATY